MPGMVLETQNLELVDARISFGTRIERSYKLTFQVKSSVIATMNEVVQFLYENLPFSLTDHGNPTAFLSSYGCSPADENKPLIFHGDANYVQLGADAFATVIEFGTNSYEEVQTQALDADGDIIPVLNSAGDPFADPVKEVVDRQLIRISKVYQPLEINPNLVQYFRNSVNQYPIQIADIIGLARSFWMKSMTPRIQIFDPVRYGWRLDMEIEFRGWGLVYDRNVLDQGFYYLETWFAPDDPEDPPPGVIRIDDAEGNELWWRRTRITVQDGNNGFVDADEAQLLNGSGGRVFDRTPGNEHFLKFRIKPEVDWSPLNLPQTVFETLFSG